MTITSPRATSRPATCPACGTECGIDEACPTCRQKAARDRLGTTLSGRYQLEQVIGRGGFGVVYRAKHLTLGSTVAVKFLLAEWARQPETRARFEREAAALVRLQHPGIVAALDFGEDDGELYLVMEWVPGENLGHKVGRLAPETIVAILDQVLAVLELAHAQGIVHRDLKPENIMLIGDRAKVLDFGLVLISDPGAGKRLTASNAVNGTCYYMSPEQCRGRDVGPPSDMYAMGIILFELLAGEPPFMGDTPVDVMMHQLVLEPPRIVDRGLGREPPAGLEAIVRACLNKNPAARPTATDMRRELRAFLEGDDAASRAARATQAKVAAAAMSRSERAIGAPTVDFAGTEAHAAPLSQRPEDHPLTMVWGFAQTESDRLRSVLSMVGIRGETWTRPGIPMGDGMRAVVIVGDEKAAVRTEALRAGPDTAKVPILIVGATADRTPALIRAGASDVILANVGDDVIGQKLWRLIRRKR